MSHGTSDGPRTISVPRNEDGSSRLEWPCAACEHGRAHERHPEGEDAVRHHYVVEQRVDSRPGDNLWVVGLDSWEFLSGLDKGIQLPRVTFTAKPRRWTPEEALELSHALARAALEAARLDDE